MAGLVAVAAVAAVVVTKLEKAWHVMPIQGRRESPRDPSGFFVRGDGGCGMRILLHEHFCSGGLAGQAADTSLLAAGAGMLRSLAEDFHVAGHDVTVVLDTRVLDERAMFPLPGRVVTIDAASPQHAHDAFEEALATVDAALVIAPETDGLLVAAVERVEQAGVLNLGSSSAAVRVVSDKHALGRRLHAQGVVVPLGELGLEHASGMIARFGEVVVKPNCGAGCVDTYACRSAADITRLPHRTDWLVQPRIHGSAASVAFILSRSGQPIPLRAGMQTVEIVGESVSGRLDYGGGRLPLTPELERRAIRLGMAALPHLRGLHGLVGIDLILGDTPATDTLIEVNPRPTVAYAGLRRLARFSIPELMMGSQPKVVWHPGGVRYQADGRSELLS